MPWSAAWTDGVSGQNLTTACNDDRVLFCSDSTSYLSVSVHERSIPSRPVVGAFCTGARAWFSTSFVSTSPAVGGASKIELALIARHSFADTAPSLSNLSNERSCQGFGYAHSDSYFVFRTSYGALRPLINPSILYDVRQDRHLFAAGLSVPCITFGTV